MKNIIDFNTRFTNSKTFKALVLKFRTALASLTSMHSMHSNGYLLIDRNSLQYGGWKFSLLASKDRNLARLLIG